MSEPLSTVLTIARTYLNDDNNTVFFDPVLIPKIGEAHRELQEELWQAGSPIVREQSDPILIAAGDTIVPAPDDLLTPTALFEATPTGSDYIPMTETFYIPLGYVQTTKLVFWCWRKEQIELGGSTLPRQVVIQYRKKIAIPVDVNDSIGILFGESYLAARAAAIAAGTLGNKDALELLTATAKENLGKILVTHRGSQKPQLKP